MSSSQDESDDIEILKTANGKLFAIKNIKVRHTSSTKIELVAEIAGDIPSAEKYLKMKTDSIEKYLKEQNEKLT